MLHDGPDQNLFTVRGGIDVDFSGMPEVFVHEQGLVRSEVGLPQVAVQLLLIGQNFHATPAENVRGSNKHGETDGFDRCSQIVSRGSRGAPRHPKSVATGEGFEPFTVAGFVDGIARGAHDGKVQTVGLQIRKAGLQRQGQIDRCLTAELKQDSMGLFTE